MSTTGGFNKEAFKCLALAEENSFWFNARNHLIIRSLKKYFPDMKKYLEIGCGTGFVLKGVSDAFSNCKIYGSELFEEGLVYARVRVPSANLIQLDAVNMTNKEEFDVFGAFDVLEHIEKDEVVMKNLYNAIQMNGGG